MFALRNNSFFHEKLKMTKQNWIWKIENLPKWPNIRIWDFQCFKFKFFCHFWFPIKKHFCFSKQIYFCLTKNFLKLIASIKKMIYYKRYIYGIHLKVPVGLYTFFERFFSSIMLTLKIWFFSWKCYFFWILFFFLRHLFQMWSPTGTFKWIP